MVALDISDIKECMAKLLLSDTFDHYLLVSGSITTYNTFQIDGKLHKQFFDSDYTEESLADRDYSLWGDLRGFCLSLIKGKRTPLDFKFVFCLSHKHTTELLSREQIGISPEAVGGIYLNFRYDGSQLTCVTGTSMNTFTMDKSLEHAWDRMAMDIFKQCKIAVSAAS